MTLHIAQKAQYEGNDWWHWSVWLEGAEDDLRDVELVTYILHPTFPDPVREVRNRKTKFRLDSAGWGEFKLKARVQHKGGKPVEQMTHDLKLRYPPAAPTRAPPMPSTGKAGPRVYLSYSSADAPIAETLKKVLARRGIRATDASGSIGSGSSWRASLSKSVTSSDAVVVLGSGAPGPWAQWEMQNAQARSIPIIPIQIGTTLPLSDQFAVQLSESPDEGEIENKIAPLVSQFLPGKKPG